MRELLTKEQLQIIFEYLKRYSDLQAWKDIEEYCYSLKTLRMSGAFNRKDKDGVNIVLKAIEANIGDLSEFCKKHNMPMFSFEDNNVRNIPKVVEDVKIELPVEEIEDVESLEDNVNELKTIYYGIYEGINDSIGLFRKRETLNNVSVKEYSVYLDYRGDVSNIITLSICKVDGTECELKIAVENSGKYIVETDGIIKSISKIVCENNKAILCEVYAIYVIDVKE